MSAPIKRTRDITQGHRATRMQTKAQRRRTDKWEAEFVACIHHPYRRCNRSGYVGYGKRQCGSCKTNRRRDGSPRPAHARNVNIRNYAKSMERRALLGGRMRGWRLVERLFGNILSDVLVREPV
jgi:hypothetical protein